MRSCDDLAENEPSARPVGRRLDAQAELRVERIRRRVQQLAPPRRYASGRSTQIGRVSQERDVEAVVARERRLEHFLLDVAVDRDRELAAASGAARSAGPARRAARARAGGALPASGSTGCDDRLERRRRELLPRRPPRRRRAGRRSGRRAVPRPSRSRPRWPPGGGPAPPWSNTSSWVTFASPIRSRTCSVPAKSRIVGDLLAFRAAVDLEHCRIERAPRSRRSSSAGTARSPRGARRRPRR